MKIKYLIPLTALFFIGFQACEKEESQPQIQTNVSENSSKSNYIPSKASGETHTVEVDNNGNMSGCGSPATDCKRFSSLPWGIANGNTFFDNDDTFKPNSFNLNYADAINLFDEEDVDGVIDGNYGVEKTFDGTIEMVAFRDLSTGEIIAGYLYE